MSESQQDLQNQLDALIEYCNIWKLKVNVGKSKVVIFSKGRIYIIKTNKNNIYFNLQNREFFKSKKKS